MSSVRNIAVNSDKLYSKQQTDFNDKTATIGSSNISYTSKKKKKSKIRSMILDDIYKL